MRRFLAGFALAMALALAMWDEAGAYDGIVEKKTFELPSYTTVNGQPIPNVRIGYETYGKLNDAKDNVILVAHFFSGTSHAAGRYSADEKIAGYWDSIIGNGLAIDTERFFVISSDTLVNLNTGDPKVITTGPASIDPATGKPWGMRFPIVTIRDFVEVQRALLESFGIKKLHAVMGPSMGALQAIEWASSYPDMVERVVAAIGAGEADPFLVGWLNIWAQPILLDPDWNGGDYYDRKPPLAGLTAALKTVTLHARYYEWAEAAFGRAWADEGKDPAKAFANKYKIEAALDAAAAARAKLSDANHFLYLVKANQTFMTGKDRSLEERLKAIEAKVLLVPSKDDLVFLPPKVEETRRLIAADGTPAEIAWLDGTQGHVDGISPTIAQAAERIKAFLEN